MVETRIRNGGSTTTLLDLSETVTDLLTDGVEVKDIVSQVQLTLDEWESQKAQETGLSCEDEYILSPDGQERIYFELPDHLIDIPSAAKEYGYRLRTIRGWVQRGLIKTHGRLRGRAPGGGYLLVKRSDLIKHMATPPNRGGRPPGISPHK